MIPQTLLAPNVSISRIIKGGWQLAGDHGPVDRARAVEAMADFVAEGVTTFDCADIYTGVEALIGAFLAIRPDPRPRVHTKFAPDLGLLAQVDRAYVRRIVDRSLSRLGLERLDMVQFHWWDYAVPGWQDVAGWLVDLQREGKVAQLAATNFDEAHIAALIEAGFPLVSLQTQYSLLDRRPAGAMARLAGEKSFRFLCYGVLAGGFLTDAWLGRPDPGFAFENRSLVKYRLIIDEFGTWDAFQGLLATCRRIADRHQTRDPAIDISTVAIRFVLDQPRVAAAIIGARYADRLAATRAAFSFSLDAEDRKALDTVLDGFPGPKGPCYGLERGGRHARIMKYNLNSGAQDLGTE